MQAEILNLLKRITCPPDPRGLTYLMVTHNLPVVSFPVRTHGGDEQGGRIVEIAPTTPGPLHDGSFTETYSKALYAASGGGAAIATKDLTQDATRP